MPTNRYGLVFLILLALPLLWGSGVALRAIHTYFSLSEQTELESVEWMVDEINGEDFRVLARYTFRWEDEVVEGVTLFQAPHFRNHWAANKNLSQFQQREWTVWFSQKDPSWSTLDRSFPYKKTSYGVILWILYGYFLFLGFFVVRK